MSRYYQQVPGRVVRHGTIHTYTGWTRRMLRDKARIRGRMVVARAHRDEFEAIKKADPDRSSTRVFQRSLRELARRHHDEYRAAYEAALTDLGYESHPCNPHPAALLSATETSAPGDASTSRELPEPGQGIEMADRTRSTMTSGSR